LILIVQSEDVPGLIDGKNALKYAGPDLEAMREIASAYKTRSLESFVATQDKYKPQLAEDPVIRFHLQALYDTLLEQNLARLVEPFSYVHIPHVASLIHLPVATVEAT
jgi:26S proteasome regulatory subunit N6